MEKKKTTINKLIEDETKVDAIIRNRLQTFPRRGGKGAPKNLSWLPEELEVRDALIMDYLGRRCCTREYVVGELSTRYDIAPDTVRVWIREALQRCVEKGKISEEQQREDFLNKVSGILQSAIDDGEKKTALRAIDILAKTFGFYSSTKDINISTDGSIKLDFGE